jgi:hypothetical protein
MNQDSDYKEKDNSIKLYEIASAIHKIEELDENQEALTEYLDSVKMQLQDKAENVVKFRQGLIMSAEAVGSEIKRLLELQNGLLRRADNIKGYLAHVMENNAIEKIETKIAKIYFLKSKTVDIVDETLIPKEYIKTKEVQTVDKMAIKRDSKDKDIPGIQITEHKNLQIK